MINWLHSRLYRPEAGWDPVPAAHAEEYSRVEWGQGTQEGLLDFLDSWVGGLAGKTVLDLGGGPGHYSLAFARRGARVTWHDISAHYRDIARARALAAGVQMRFSIGYMDEAHTLVGETFDLVFNRICWRYGRGDRSFSRTIWALVNAGGSAYVDTTVDDFEYDRLNWTSSARVQLNRVLSWKVGHPLPPHRRVARLFMSLPVEKILADYSSPPNDRVLVRKRG